VDTYDKILLMSLANIFVLHVSVRLPVADRLHLFPVLFNYSYQYTGAPACGRQAAPDSKPQSDEIFAANLMARSPQLAAIKQKLHFRYLTGQPYKKLLIFR